MRRLALPVLVLLSAACFKIEEDGGDELASTDSGSGDSDESSSDESSSESSSSDSSSDSSDGSDDLCEPGTLGCVCLGGDSCEAGLSCVAGVCEEPACGNGVVDPDEECDDGNDVDDDACSNACVLPVCGDGIVQQGEECDDGNANDTDACTSSCLAAACGDGILQIGEGCDDGNDNDLDECSNECSPASCGDGVINGTDECDDGNNVNNDACSNACKLPICGDGIVQQSLGEECDDGNTFAKDLCTNSCQMRDCNGLLFNPGNGYFGCWYTSAVNTSCNQLCATHGGFDATSSKHTGNEVGKQLWPAKANRGNWVTIECSSIDNNTNWGANGTNPDGNWKHPSCHANCACNL